MNADRWTRIRDLLERAFELDSDDRRRFLDEECGGDAALRAELDALLAADEDDGDLSAVVDEAASDLEAERAPSDLAGRRIGSYLLLRMVASGGMGAVYEAEQDEPRRRVALKTLRLGFDSDEARRRFRYESEILGHLSHDGIARIHETGTHREGDLDVPWFAMEFVEGARTIVRHVVDEATARDARLALFVEACEAVHHGHEKGVIHRDLKPGNILVNEAGRVKVIDFGVARAADADLGLSMLQTKTGQLVGTLKYMSPEQIGGRPQDIDVRTDVFALGLVLIEMLTGDECRELGESFTEAARIVQAGEVRALRTIDGRQPEELEWIIGKATDSDRRQRYASAAELARDVRRFMAREPIEAAAPSTLYLTRKFVARHRTAVAFALVIVVFLAVGLVGTTFGLQREKRERQRFEATNEFLVSMFESVSAWERGHDTKVADILDAAVADLDERFADDPALRVEMLEMLAQSYIYLGLQGQALPLMEERHARLDEVGSTTQKDRLQSALGLGMVLSETNRLEDAERLLRDAAAGFLAEGDSEHQHIQSLIFHSKTLRKLRRIGDARPFIEDAIARYCPDGRITRAGHAYLYDQLALVDEYTDHLPEALASQEKVRVFRVERYGPDDPDVLGSTINYASLLVSCDRKAEALALLEDVIPRCERVFGPDHRTTMIAVGVYAGYLELEDARPWLELRAQRSARALGPADPRTVQARTEYGQVLGELGRLDEAAAVFGDQLAALEAADSPDVVEIAIAKLFIGRVHHADGRPADAEPLVVAAYEAAVADPARFARSYMPVALRAAELMVSLVEELGRPEEVVEWEKRRDAAKR